MASCGYFRSSNMSRKSFRGASAPVGTVIQVLKWMITANVARSRIPLFSEAVIRRKWSRKSHILIAYIDLGHPPCMMHGACHLETNTTFRNNSKEDN